MSAAARAIYAAYLRPEPTGAQKAAARALLARPDAPAAAVLVAAKHLLGPTFLSFEPETYWLSLPELHAANRDKLLAAQALAMTPAFFWDPKAFTATTEAFNDLLVNAGAVPFCSPAHMAWAVTEATYIYAVTETAGYSGDVEAARGGAEPEFDDSVCAYVAVALFEAGFMTAPSPLGFAENELQKQLERVPENAAATKQLRQKVVAAWSALDEAAKPDAVELKNDSIGAQLLKLADCKGYVEERLAALDAALRPL